MGQFLDHDMTFDASSPLGVPTPPESITNARTPSFDLDSVYGAGPTASPVLYDPADGAKLRIGFGGRFEDLPRTSSGQAVLGDPRNDENMMIGGIHCAFILAHNKLVDQVRAANPQLSNAQVFAQARRTLTFHYHSIILHEILPLFIGQPMVDQILSFGRNFYRPAVGQAFMPVEFQGAAYRFGHSMVRPSYRANRAGNADNSPFFGFIFDPSQETNPDPNDLRGGRRAARRFIGWQTFFNFGDGQVKTNKRIDTKLHRAVQPAAGRHCQWRPADRAAGTQPAAPAHLVDPVGTGDRDGDARARAGLAERIRRTEDLRRRPGDQHTAVVLRAQGGRGGAGRHHARTRRYAHRRRGLHRTAAGRPQRLLPAPTQLQANFAGR
jgi:hypothetical protein